MRWRVIPNSNSSFLFLIPFSFLYFFFFLPGDLIYPLPPLSWNDRAWSSDNKEVRRGGKTKQKQPVVWTLHSRSLAPRQKPGPVWGV